MMEAFAFRYNECNPALFTSSDQPYILAFSMIMLHTDAFNRAAKTKMSRSDYVKNTRIDGISTDLLEYIYDNIVYAPFIYAADDDGDTLAHRSLSETSMASSGVATASSRDKSKADVYGLIASGDMSRLRVDIQMQIPVKSGCLISARLLSSTGADLIRYPHCQTLSRTPGQWPSSIAQPFKMPSLTRTISS